MLTFSKNKERKIFKTTKKGIISPILLQLTSSDEDPDISSPLVSSTPILGISRPLVSSTPIPFSPSDDELEMSIALRKGTRAYTKHPISKFVSYTPLSLSYKTFVAKLDYVS